MLPNWNPKHYTQLSERVGVAGLPSAPTPLHAHQLQPLQALQCLLLKIDMNMSQHPHIEIGTKRVAQ